MKLLPAKRQEENCAGMYLKGLKNQNGEHLVSQVLWSTGHSIDLARTLFPFKSTNNIQIKVTHHKVIGDAQWQF